MQQNQHNKVIQYVLVNNTLCIKKITWGGICAMTSSTVNRFWKIFTVWSNSECTKWI